LLVTRERKRKLDQKSERGEDMRVNKLLTLSVLVITISVISSPSFANAEIKVTPPLNWIPSPTNNSTKMEWFQNSTKSLFAIINPPIDIMFPLFLMASGMAQSFADQGILESVDQTAFGHSNFGHRYFLNVSSRSDIANASSSTLIDVKGFLDQMSGGHEVLFKEMLIITEKKGELYGIILLSPRENFDSKLNELKPTIDSIQLGNSTATNQTLLE
jgi:hypothetical protein